MDQHRSTRHRRGRARSTTALAGLGLVGALLVGAPVGGAQAASQFSSMRITVPDLVRTSTGCVDHSVGYQVSGSAPDPGTWSLELRLFEPGASEPTVVRKHHSIRGADTSTGRISLQVCGNVFTPGTYYLEQRLTHGPDHSRLLSSASALTVRPARTRTKLKVTKPGGQHRARIRVNVETPRGYVRRPGTKVWLQYRAAGGWKRVPGSAARTGSNGVVLVTFRSPRPHGRVQVRAAAAKGTFHSASRSVDRTIGG